MIKATFTTDIVKIVKSRIYQKDLTIDSSTYGVGKGYYIVYFIDNSSRKHILIFSSCDILKAQNRGKEYIKNSSMTIIE